MGRAGCVVYGGRGAGCRLCTALTLEDAIKRAQGETADARALASSIEEANAYPAGAVGIRVYKLVSDDVILRKGGLPDATDRGAPVTSTR